MWSFWSRDPTKDFGYEIQDIVSSDDKSIWVLHKAKKKVLSPCYFIIIIDNVIIIIMIVVQSSGELVSIFRYEVKPNGENHIDRAKNAIKRLKTLRHPSILTYVDSLEVWVLKLIYSNQFINNLFVIFFKKTDKSVYVVTEFVEPLENYLQNISDYTQQQKQLAISYGLLQVAVSFPIYVINRHLIQLHYFNI